MRNFRLALASEFAKLSWRHPLWWAIIPLAIVVPFAINFGIARATDAGLIDGSGGMDTNNAAYWVIIFSTFILMFGGVSSLCGEFQHGTVDTVFAIAPRRRNLPLAKLVLFGGISTAVTAIAVLLIFTTFPVMFPTIWGRVDLFSPAGLRLLIGTPLLSFFVATLGIGISLLIPRTGIVVMIVLLWKFGVEVFLTYIQGDVGRLLQRLSPFSNGELGAGQNPTFESLFGGPNGSLAYFAVISLVVLAAGVAKLTVKDVYRD